MGKGRCEEYCLRKDFPLPHMGKSLQYRDTSKKEGITWRKCNQCVYVTFTDKQRCPCCNLQFSMRKRNHGG